MLSHCFFADVLNRTDLECPSRLPNWVSALAIFMGFWMSMYHVSRKAMDALMRAISIIMSYFDVFQSFPRTWASIERR
jgi:isopenicillin N synthase-like dioxygenase